MLKVGLVTGSVTPSARAAPRTSVVLPEPSSPRTSTTSPSLEARRQLGAQRFGLGGTRGFDDAHGHDETLEPAGTAAAIGAS